MKIAIIGQKWLAEQLLLDVSAQYEVTVVAAPNPADRLYIAATERGITAFVHGSTLEGFDMPAVDLLICANSFVPVPASVRDRARYSIGYHPSLLPLHKGRHSVDDTIAAGDRITGGTVYHLTNELDGGPVAFQEWSFIQPGETAAGLWRRALAPMGLSLLTKAADHLAAYGFLPAEEQFAL